MTYRIIPLQYEYKKIENVEFHKGYGLILKNEKTENIEIYIDLTNHLIINRDDIEEKFNHLFIKKNELNQFEHLTEEEMYKLQDYLLEFLNIYYSINYLSQQISLTYHYMDKEKPFDKKYKGIHKLLEKGYMKNNEKINDFFNNECIHHKYGDRLKRKFNELRSKKDQLENKDYIKFMLEVVKREF